MAHQSPKACTFVLHSQWSGCKAKFHLEKISRHSQPYSTSQSFDTSLINIFSNPPFCFLVSEAVRQSPSLLAINSSWCILPPFQLSKHRSSCRRTRVTKMIDQKQIPQLSPRRCWSLLNGLTMFRNGSHWRMKSIVSIFWRTKHFKQPCQKSRRSIILKQGELQHYSDRETYTVPTWLIGCFSLRKWKMKLKEWNFEKHLSKTDMAVIVAKSEKRLREEGKQTAFFHGGSQITLEKLENFKRRKTLTSASSPSACKSAPKKFVFECLPNYETRYSS